MNSGYYSRSKRQQAEPEKPQSQYQWRTRVNTLMNTSDEPRESKLTSGDRYFSSSSDGKSRESSDGARKSNTIFASRWPKDDREDEQKYPRREELRRERFLRTKSDDHLKTRVRFSSDELPTTSKSLDDDDEVESMSFSNMHSRDKRQCKQDWNRNDDGDDDDSRRRRSESEADNMDNDDSCYGACSGSFDSGLDLRVSWSPDERESFMDDYNENLPVRCRSHSSASNESLSSKYHEDSPIETSSLSATSSSRPIPGAPTVDSIGSGAVPKRPTERTFIDHDFEISETKPRGENPWDEFTTSNPVERSHYNHSYPPRHSFSDMKYSTRRQMNDRPRDTRDAPGSVKDNRGEKETVTTNEIPGFSFFSDNEDYMEDIIQKVIDAEEKQVDFDTEDMERLNGALMLSEENEDMAMDIGKEEKSEMSNIEFEDNNITSDKPRHEDHKPFFERKRASSLPARVEDNEDYITRLLFHSWKFSARKGEEKQDQDEGVDDEWACVPSVFLEDVFTLLSPKERHQASQVCQHWYDLFYSPRVWETFILLEKTLTKKRFNLYKGYQRELCPWKTQICLKRVGSFFKRIVITPISDYFNLCEFLRVLAAFLEYQVNQGEKPMPMLHTFDFTFACATRSSEGLLVHGTGGQILDMIVKLLTQMTNLKNLKVNQLLTDIVEVPEVFSALTQCFDECLSSLEMLNVTKVPYAITELSQFRNLLQLTVSPQHISDEVVVLLAGINLLHLHLIQDNYTCECLPVHSEAWKLVKEMAPWLRVYLEISGITRNPLLIQPRAPVYGVFFRTPFSRLTNDVISDIVEHYSKTLRYLVQEHLPRTHGPRGLDKRCDSSLLFMIRRCQKLHTLVVSERLSTSTLILLATEGKNLTALLVRQNALIKRCDWTRCGEWSSEFYTRLKENALDYHKCKNEICSILKRRWRPLSDKQFMRLKIVPKVEMFY